MTSETSVAPASALSPASTVDYMRAAKRWLLWREIPNSDPAKKPRKVPYYVNGTERGKTDCPEDWAQLATYDDASKAVSSYTGLAFALGPDGTGWHWQGIDLDEVPQGQLDSWAISLPGYVEVSPSGNGLHAIGYGRSFQSLGPNGSGFEAYAAGRYFTVTCDTRKNERLTCLAELVETKVAPLHSRPAASGTGTAYVDPKTVTELRSALQSLRSDDRELWVRMGHALQELGDVGRSLWIDWSQTSDKWEPTDAKKWDTFKSDRTGYQAIFAEAQRNGWVNPGSKSAQLETPTTQGEFKFKFTKPGEPVVTTKYILDPWLPRATVIGCYGRGEAGKSSWVAQACALASPQVSSLWITSEETPSYIRQRHLSCGGETRTLAVPDVIPTKFDPVTKKPVATSFNVYEHLEPAIEAFKAHPETRQDRPLGIVVLDAVVALVTWKQGENANSDEGVKRLIATLVRISERHGITIIILGHLNKGTHREHIADAVTGSAAWTNSVRLAFMFVKDIESQNYEGFVRTVKSNTGTHFGSIYKTVPVYTLRERPDGNHDVLCGVQFVTGIVWGELALREMMVGEKDDELLNRVAQKRSKIHTLVEATLAQLRSNPCTTRKAVEATIQDKVNNRHWQKADEILSSQHGVDVQPSTHGELSYSMKRTVH